VLLYSCKKENDSSTAPPPAGSTGTITATVTGRAIDENNNAVINASVSINGQLTTTDQHGIFLLKNISVDSRCIATNTKTGFFNCNHAFKVSANTVNYIHVVLISNAQTHTLSAPAGGTVSLTDGSSIQFAPNSFVNATTGSAYTGTVSLSVKHLSPEEANFGFMIPGGDLLGKDAGGNDVALYTYGMLGAELKGSSGEQLQLATGSNASLTMAIAASQISSAPFSIPLWYFDEATSLWKEEGSATKVGSNYVGTVSHFSWWNLDVPGNKATIIGKVLDCNSVPMSNIVVTVNEFYTLITNNLGVYSNWVPAGMPLTVQVLSSANSNLFPNSQLENVPPLSSNQTFYVPDLLVPCPAYMAGNLKKCSGESIDGLVVLNWSGVPMYEYTTNGHFNLICPATSTINLKAYSFYNSNVNTYSGTYTTGTTGSTTNVGDITLCNIDTLDNFLLINGGPFSNVLFDLSLSTSYVTNVSSNILRINYGATTSTDYSIGYYNIYVDRTTPGTSVWNYPLYSYITLNIYGSSTSYSISTANSGNTGSTLLDYVGNTGDIVRGSFNGAATCTAIDSTETTVTISGNFDVIRQ
jgi:hypothetical protein